jgi:hypothetical protein
VNAATPTPLIILHADGLGEDATEADFDAWAAFVDAEIDKRCGFDVTVEQARFGVADRDQIRHTTDAQEQVIREALIEIWNDWCAQGAPA